MASRTFILWLMVGMFAGAAWSDAVFDRHVLSRLTYGPTPAEEARIGSLGVTGWIESQLHPEAIDDSEVEAMLSPLETLNLPGGDLYCLYLEPTVRPSATLADTMEVVEPRPQAIHEQLVAAKILRATYAKRQLEEIMVDFWFNHFNVYWGKEECRWLVPSFERDAIRPYALGTFRELLGAVAHHPAMLYYLDNYVSTAARPGKKGGLNENYARELLELHTLGVEGGYTQQDVIAVARIFTGWTVDKAKVEPAYLFRRGQHDDDDKLVLGVTISGEGHTPDEGERVLDLLACHPATAHFIALKLCRRFIADVPPPEAVAVVATAFMDSGGDLRVTLRALFGTAAFTGPDFRRAKIKTPIEFLVSALRALDADAGPPRAYLDILRRMGDLPYSCEPPTGYPDVAAPWMNAGALLARMRLADRLTNPRDARTCADPERLAGCPVECEGDQAMTRLWERLVGIPMTETTHAVLAQASRDPEIRRAVLDDPTGPPDYPKLAALMLGSPEFQRR